MKNHFKFSRVLACLLTLLGSVTPLLFSACSKKKSPPVAAPTVTVEDYCPHLPSLTFSPAVTVSGTAGFDYRLNGNGAVTGPAAIRYAEVMVKDSSDRIVQCAETDSAGAFSFQLPADGATYTVQVNTRANNSSVKAYVMNNPTNNEYYFIADSVTTSADATLTFTASAVGTLEGGAFNILDRIYRANAFLRDHASTSDCSAFAGCTAFSVAPLAYAYWTKGFNPGEYLGASTGASFYLKGTNELYILGGEDGDVDESDCDHFDNTIIIHEYGHFIENYYTVTDSPGGVHRPNQTIDPRLAWGEAWANFFNAAVNVSPVYRDTEGNVDCVAPPTPCTRAFLNESLEDGNYDNGVDEPATGEGVFREFSITRILWDGLDPHPDDGTVGGTDSGADTIQSPFAEIWTVLTSTSGGFSDSSNRFRHVGLFHKIHQNLSGAQDWSAIITREEQTSTLLHFATPLTLGGSCSPVNIQAEGQTDGSFEFSNLFYDNDFYVYTHAGGVLSVTMSYTTTNADLDLIVWRDGYTYGNTDDMLGSSINATDGGDEAVALAAPAGTYMINVMVNPELRRGSPSDYTLEINGQTACPNP